MENKKDQDMTINLSISETCKPLLKKSKLLFVKKDENENYRVVKNYNICLLINSLFSILSLALMILFWLTDAYNQIVIQKIILRNGSEMLGWYLKPPFAPTLKVYVFNYTNIDEYVSGIDKKIRVNEVGPYVYVEPIERINVQFEDNRITFNENRSHTFMPELSGTLSEDDVIIAPNLPFLSALPNVEKLSFVTKLGFNTLLTMTKPKEFQNITIRDFFHGYRDDFMNLVSKIKWDFTPEDVGFLAPRRGVSKLSLTTNSGTKNSDDIGRVHRLGSNEKLDIWKTDKCNEISGNDGIFCGPKMVRNKQPIKIFLPEICRPLPLVFDKEATIHGNIPSYYYVAPENTFSKPSDKIKNDYYCELKSVNYEHVNGVLDVSDCIEGSPPIFVSHPHYLEGDEALFENIEGLSPNKSIHNSYVYLHPRLSVPVFGTSRMQLSLKLHHYKSHYQHYPNNLILPLGWVETTTNNIPEEFKFKLYLSTVVADWVEIAFKYGSIFTFIATLILFLFIIKNSIIATKS